MNRQQVLERAIRKAIDGGWIPKERQQSFAFTKLIGTQIIEVTDAYKQVWMVNDLIFSQDFAKALWSENNVCPNCGGYETMPDKHPGRVEHFASLHHQQSIPAYKHHLQQMVIADDPIKYLEENM